MKSVTDDVRELIQEAKLRTAWWILCIFSVTYLLTHTSKSMIMNVPIAVLLVSGLRILFNEVEFKWKVRTIRPTSYLTHLEKKQLSLSDARISTTLSAPQEWRKKIDSPVVEAAIEDFLDKVLQDFVMDLWYSAITPDKEAPELIRAIAMDALGEVSLRVKELNLVDLLLSDIVDLVGDHLDLFRKNQAAIGRDVMGTLSSEERDERLKHHLMASKELHPALISPEYEYKVLQQLIGGLLAVVLGPREAKCPLVRCITRELLTCLVMEPIINFASPGYINEVLEYVILLYDSGGLSAFSSGQAPNTDTHNSEPTVPAEHGSNNQRAEVSLSQVNDHKELESSDSGNPLSSTMQDESLHHADWVKGFEAASQRRTEVLMPENLENMWAIGTHYKKQHLPKKDLMTEAAKGESRETETSSETEVSSTIHEHENAKNGVSQGNRKMLVRSHSTNGAEVQSNHENMVNRKGSAVTKSNSGNVKDRTLHKGSLDTVSRDGVLHAPKLRCRVFGASFEKLDSNSFAVYAICVTSGHTSWFLKRRYRNFERLHRHLKDIPNFTLHLPPKRIFSSSTEDAFVHQRCIQLDKYLHDLLSIANVAEQHEVWDFLSASSKNYSFGTSSSAMTTLAVRVDDAMDEIERQFKGVSGGIVRMVGGSSYEQASPAASRSVSWNAGDINKLATRKSASNSHNSFSDNEEGDKDVNGWHLDNEMKADPTGVPPEWTPPNLSVPVLNLVDKVFQLERRGWLRRQVFWISKQILQLAMEDAIDDCFLRQIQWLRREDVIAQGIRWVQDFLWPNGTFFVTLRIEGKNNSESEADQEQQNSSQQRGGRFNKMGSFEQQLEASRRASDVKNFIFNGAPVALVSFIGHKQYMRCARDIYYFLQSTVCLKQLAYGILELVLLSLFPELRDVVRDIHEEMHRQPSYN